ncbi:MAG: GYD domain-containing protein [Nitrososphaerales archaeon]
MPVYMIQAAYTPEALATIINKPQNRFAAIKSSLENLGGRLKDAYFTFGKYDLVIIAEMPDNVSAVAVAMAFSAGGAVKSLHTTPLITGDEAMEAMKKASKANYRPPS